MAVERDPVVLEMRAETAELQLTVEKVERTRIVEVLVSLKKPAKEAAA